MSDDPANLHFADGLSEELLNLLSRIPELRVVARTSSFSFRDRAVSAATIARKLSVAHLLEGSVRKSGSRLRITAQLIRASDSSHAWSRSFDRDLSDVFAVQDEIAAAVVNELQIKLLGGVAPKARPTDPEAYVHYLNGRHFLDLASEFGYSQAVASLESALAIDPGFGPAWAMLGALYWGQANNSLIDYGEGSRLARAHSARAHALDPDLAEAISLLGYLDVLEGVDIEGGTRRVERACELEPHNQRVLTRAANIALRRGNIEEAIRCSRGALQVDPLSANAHAIYGNVCYYAGRLEEAESMRRRVLELSPGWLSGYYNLGKVLLARGESAVALAAMQQEPSPFWRLTGLVLAHHALGQTAESDAALQELSRLGFDGGTYQIAQVHAYRGEIDIAFEWLDRAVAKHDSALTFAHVDPVLDNLRGDSRWERFLSRNGLLPS
jgi:TolB-like protein/Flp pilus assembly protein TadD